MGLLSRIFGTNNDGETEQYNSLLDDEKAQTAEEKARYEELKKKQEVDRLALKARGGGQRGGGRTGLMYGQNQQGVA